MFDLPSTRQLQLYVGYTLDVNNIGIEDLSRRFRSCFKSFDNSTFLKEQVRNGLNRLNPFHPTGPFLVPKLII